MTTSVSRPGRDIFSRSALTTSLCDPLVAPVTATNLGERVRRLQQMLMERQNNGSNSVSASKNSYQRENRIVTENSCLKKKQSANSSEYVSSPGRKSKELEKRPIPTISVEQYDDSHTSALPAGHLDIHNNLSEKLENDLLKTTKEKSRTVRKYLGSLTSTRYLHSIFSPIIKESSSEDSKHHALSTKHSFSQPNADDNVCAIVVPSESTTQIPVIKRRSMVREIDLNEGVKGKNITATLCSGVPSSLLQKETGCTTRYLLDDGKTCTKDKIERQGSKRRSYAGDDRIFRIPFLNSSVVTACRQKSAVYDSSPSSKVKSTSDEGTDELNSDGKDGKNLEKQPSSDILTVTGNALSISESFKNDGGIEETEKSTFKNIIVGKSSSEFMRNEDPLVSVEDKRLMEENELAETVPIKEVPLSKVEGEVKRLSFTESLFPNPNHSVLSGSPASYYRGIKLPLPPLPEVYSVRKSFDESSQDVDKSPSGLKTRKTPLRAYGRSHTTSTYNGCKDAAPDASPRRHLIGFLHRTSHLSLTSELSADASFYLIG
ncbi:unnamed protein product [Enterobius vermicularis]|uniref:Wiskott-Aldrich syndrome protein family member n=1 Tax=Enterobius vermicularis TaxID=51028 RepID=A0A0N4V1F4_ENTVE|nr:unnamed protein product [Enterobius vermicularis]